MKPTLVEDRSGNLQVWDHPKDGVEYVIGADPAENKRRDRSAIERRTKVSYSDQRPDYSAVIVLELITGLHVASWHGYCPPDEFSTVIAAIGYYYNTALVVPEINGPGLAVVTRLAETIRYDNLYRTQMFNVMDRDPFAPQWGWRTDAHTRGILITRVHECLNSGALWTRDASLVSELRTMEFDDAGVPRARGKNKDDRVLALAMALQGRHQAIFQTGGVHREANKRASSYEERIWEQVKERNEHGNHSSDRTPGAWRRGPAPRRPPRV